MEKKARSALQCGLFGNVAVRDCAGSILDRTPFRTTHPAQHFLQCCNDNRNVCISSDLGCDFAGISDCIRRKIPFIRQRRKAGFEKILCMVQNDAVLFGRRFSDLFCRGAFAVLVMTGERKWN